MSNNLITYPTIVPAWNIVSQSNNITENFIFNSDRDSEYYTNLDLNILK